MIAEVHKTRDTVLHDAASLHMKSQIATKLRAQLQRLRDDPGMKERCKEGARARARAVIKLQAQWRGHHVRCQPQAVAHRMAHDAKHAKGKGKTKKAKIEAVKKSKMQNNSNSKLVGKEKSKKSKKKKKKKKKHRNRKATTDDVVDNFIDEESKAVAADEALVDEFAAQVDDA